MTTLAKNSGIWQWALFSFVLAGLTGFVFRMGFVFPLPEFLNLENIRHAHSHLMFFGWASLLPLYFIKLDIISGYHAALGARLMKNSLWWILIFGILSFPVFLLFGYQSVSISSTSLPLAVIFSGMVMLGWYGFMAGYVITKFKKKNFQANIFYEAALVMLFICSLGAWSVGGTQIFEIGGPLLPKALTHFFLANFVEGWVILVLMGFISKALAMKEDDFVVSPTALVALIAVGAPFTFPYGFSEGLINFDLSVAARTGGILIAEGVLLFAYSIIRTHRNHISLWIWPIIFLVLKSLMQITASVTPMGMWLADHGVRILYLHTTLLGALSTGIIWFLYQMVSMKRIYFYAVLISIAMLIGSLVLPTSILPVTLFGAWVYKILAIVAIFPVIAVLFFWLKLGTIVEQEHHPKHPKDIPSIRREAVL